MSYEVFLQEIKSQVEKKMGKGVRVRIYPVTKYNGVQLDSLSILCGEDNASPAIYLNDFYRSFLEGETIDRIVDRILVCYQQGISVRNMDLSFFLDITRVRQHVVCRLINYRKNRKLLEQVPYRVFLDLAVVYYCQLEHPGFGPAAILIRNEHLKMWKVDEEMMHTWAVKNMKEQQPWDFLSMAEMMRSLTECDLFAEEESEIPLYILSNQEKNFGAVWMTDPEVLEMIGKKLEEDYFILPSSVHECMVVPVSTVMDAVQLQEMVHEMNETQVEPEEVLADTVYRYDRRTGKLRMAVM